MIAEAPAGLAPARSPVVPVGRRDVFLPVEPANFASLKIPQAVVEALVLKLILGSGVVCGRQVADELCLPFGLASELLRQMKTDQLIAHRKSRGLNDYEWEMTVQGSERARRLFEQSPYVGAVPVTIEDYTASVMAQSPTKERPTAALLQKALGDLLISPDVFSRLGQALTSVGAMFLYGAPGNGKTSIAERLTNAFGPHVWIPRAIYVDGEVVRLYDPIVHQAIPLPDKTNLRVDPRWVLIARPTIVVGGELTLDSLDMRVNASTGCVEAPIHMKSNCGALVVDDFGRQRTGTRELLNRWIVPLEKKYDFVNTPTGRKVQIPFEQLIAFATNLDPSDLVDEAFLRRIPYKIEVHDPSEPEFRVLFRKIAEKHGMRHDEAALDHLIEKWYRPTGRPFRYCQPRDLLRQVADFCTFHERALEVTREGIDAAASNYFAVMATV